jgi:hypothetical protein
MSIKSQRKAERLAVQAATIIRDLSDLLDSPDPAVASDAKEYLIGLAKCLNYNLDGRGLAVVKVYDRYTNGGAK